MGKLSAIERGLLLTAQLILLVGIGLQWFDGGLSGNWSYALLAMAILNLAFIGKELHASPEARMSLPAASRHPPIGFSTAMIE